jgi:hypothetical protein
MFGAERKPLLIQPSRLFHRAYLCPCAEVWNHSPLTDGRYNALTERVVLTVSPKINDVYPAIPNPRSTYMAQVAGRTVVDIRSPRQFSAIARRLTALEQYGFNNCIVLIHVWQGNGYDNALPSHYPADRYLGGDFDLRQTVVNGRKSKCYVGLHENYADYFPNYPGFTRDAIALSTDGQPILSYFNPWTNIQSFAAKSAWMAKHASTESVEIHRRYETNASFIDVNSAMPPWWRADMDARSAAAGMFRTFQDASASLWKFQSQTHEGPVFGEGRDHWAWSGLLDGVEAQFGAGGTEQNAGTAAPLFVDFDLLKIHPLQVNHGMGYYDRWLKANQDMSSTEVADAYRMQEVAFGHAPYIEDALWHNTARFLIEHRLISPLASRYGIQAVRSIAYQVNGIWKDSSAAALNGDFSRVRVTYANGDTITANSHNQVLNAGGLNLPQYGWSAVGQDLVAYTALRNGIIADYAQTGSSFFANARNQSDLNASGTFAEPAVKRFAQTGARAGEFQVSWKALDSAGSPDYVEFVHFVNHTGKIIAFQADHSLQTPTSQWKPGQTIQDVFRFSVPPNVPDGAYSVRLGLYFGDERSYLLGTDDGERRYVVGNLILKNGGTMMSFSAERVLSLAPDPRLNSSGTVVNFGTMQTDGMVSVVQEENQWVLRAYPQHRNVIVRLNKASFAAPAAISCDNGEIVSRVPVHLNGYWQISTLGFKDCRWPAK